MKKIGFLFLISFVCLTVGMEPIAEEAEESEVLSLRSESVAASDESGCLDLLNGDIGQIKERLAIIECTLQRQEQFNQLVIEVIRKLTSLQNAASNPPRALAIPDERLRSSLLELFNFSK